VPDSYTPAAERALAAAGSWAARLGAAGIQPCHVLLGLLDEEEGRAALLIEQCGISAEQVRQALSGHSTDQQEALSGSTPGRTPVTLQLLRQARELAADATADRTVSTEQLLLAALREDAELRRQLEGLGLAFSALETSILAEHQLELRLEEPLQLGVAGEETDTARVLDAAANRAREAGRVVEDYCRFVLDDAFLSGECKRLRHDLAEALEAVPMQGLLSARDTLRDVGTTLSTEREQQRHSLAEVLHANLKRLQEALRTLEEFGKLRGAELGKKLEALRYRAYTLERALVIGRESRQRLAEVKLCVLVTGSTCAASLDWTIQEAVAGGAGMIQLREKELNDRQLLERARRVRKATCKLGVLFIVNDRPDIARLAEADGVHLGQDDLPIKESRRIVGPDTLIGVSTHDLAQLRQAMLDGANYVGVGPTFPSGTKQFNKLSGLEFVRQAMAETSLPAFVIGGITPDTIADAIAAGARRVAVSQAICAAEDPRAVAAALSKILASSSA
jgi:thiamine-phosphate pyrophosphorylase